MMVQMQTVIRKIVSCCGALGKML